MKVKVTQLGPTLCDLTDYTVHGILQAPSLQVDSLPAKPPGSVTNSPRFNGLEQQPFILSHQSTRWLGSSANLIVVMLPYVFKVH